MKLGINGWRIHGQRTGVGRYLLNVIKNWTEEMVDGRFDEINFYTPKPIDHDEIPLPKNFACAFYRQTNQCSFGKIR